MESVHVLISKISRGDKIFIYCLGRFDGKATSIKVKELLKRISRRKNNRHRFRMESSKPGLCAQHRYQD